MNKTDPPAAGQVAQNRKQEATVMSAKPTGTPFDRPSNVRPVIRDEGGDPVCWLEKVCPTCGLFIGDTPPTTCPRCGGLSPIE